MNAHDQQILGFMFLAMMLAGCIGMGIWEIIRIKLVKWSKT